MPWTRPAKIAFIGSHSVRKSNAVHAFASTIGRAGRSVEVGREVVRFNPLGLNEGATPEAQLWVLMAQVQQELELAGDHPGVPPFDGGQDDVAEGGGTARRGRKSR